MASIMEFSNAVLVQGKWLFQIGSLITNVKSNRLLGISTIVYNLHVYTLHTQNNEVRYDTHLINQKYILPLL